MSGASAGGQPPTYLDTHSTYLDTHFLRPGDVLLSRGSGVVSAALAKFSGGDYSHAALVLDSHSLFEADGYGVGFTPVSAILVKVAGKTRKWWKFSDGRQVLVLRHPDLASRYPDTIGLPGLQLLDAVREAVAPYLGQPYSHLERLAKASLLPAGLQPALRQVLRLWQYVDSMRGTDRNLDSCLPGLFCSEVIVEVYQRLGVALFAENRPAGIVSPNALVSALCKLTERVTGALATAEQVKKARGISRLDLVGLPTRQGSLPPLVSIIEANSNLSHALTVLTQSVESQVDRQVIPLGNFEAAVQEMLQSARQQNMSEPLIRMIEKTLDQLRSDQPLANQWVENRKAYAVEELHAYGRTLENFGSAVYLYAASIADRVRLQRRQLRSLLPDAHRAVDVVECSRQLHRLAKQARADFYQQLAHVKSLYKAHDEWQSGRRQAQLMENLEFCEVKLPVNRFTDLDEFVSFRIKEELAVKSDEVLNEVASSEAAQRALSTIPDITDRVSWLRDNVEITFPGSQRMRIGIRGLEHDLLRSLADAVEQAYQRDAIRRAESEEARGEQNRAQAERWGEMLMSLLKSSSQH